MSDDQQHIWSKDAFLAKSLRYATVMLSQNREDWQFGFWSTLSLEMLAKAVVANISPTLVADGKNWNNTYFSLGHQPNEPRYLPRTIDTSNVLNRLETLVSDFTREMRNFCITHMNRRNTELHSGDLPFDSLGTSEWLSKYYEACTVLLRAISEDLVLLVGEDEARTAEGLIASLNDDVAKSVQRTINAHRTVWEGKEQDERDSLTAQANALASRHFGHRVPCPSCGTTALLQGSATGAPASSIEDDLVVERQSMLPASFECTACGLKISGYSRLNACGLGDSFTSTSRYEAAEYFDINLEYELEPDFNEY